MLHGLVEEIDPAAFVVIGQGLSLIHIYGTVLYDHWYSWHWRYQLFDDRVYVSWFAHADALLADLAAFGDAGPLRAIALPASAAARPVVRRLAESGYRLEPLPGQDGAAGVIIYRISR